MKRSAVFNLVILFLTGSVAAQLDLSQIYSRSMNGGYTMLTVIDSLKLDTKVNNGIAQTRMGLVLVPGSYRNFVV